MAWFEAFWKVTPPPAAAGAVLSCARSAPAPSAVQRATTANIHFARNNCRIAFLLWLGLAARALPHAGMPASRVQPDRGAGARAQFLYAEGGSEVPSV